MQRLIIKYSITLLFALLLNVAKGQVENTVVSGSYENENLHSILKSISKNYDVKFAFDGFALKSIKSSGKFVDQPLTVILNSLLTPANQSYRVIDDTIVIFEVVAKEPDSIEPNSDINSTQPIILRGELRDQQTGELLPFATVMTLASKAITTTDEDGKFYLNFIPIPKDSLLINFIGYEQLIIPLNKIKNNEYRKISLLTRRNFLPSVVIEAEGVKLLETGRNAGLQTFNPNDLATSQGTGEADIFRAAQLLPGISATQESSSGLFIRGSDSDQTMVTMDGFTVYHLDHFFGAFTAINSNAVKTMRIHKGGLEAKHGGRIGGLVEIIGKEGNLYKPATQIDLGPLSAGFSVESPLDNKQKSSVIITGRRAFTDAVFSPTYKKLFNTAYNASVSTSLDNEVESFGEGEEPNYFFNDMNAKFSFRPTTKDIINVSGYASKDKLFVQYADTFQNELINTLDVKYTDESTWSNKGFSTRWNHTYNDKWQSNFQIGFSEYLTDYFSLDTIFEVLTNQKKIAFSSDKNDLNDLNAKLELTSNIKNHKRVFGFNLNNVTTTNSTRINTENTETSNQKGNTYSFFMQDEYSGFKNWNIQGGLRLNYFDRTNNVYPEPRINANYKIKDGMHFKFSAGRIHQFIHRIRSQSLYINTPDIWQLSGNTNIPVLKSDQLLTGINYSKGKLTLDCELYYKKLEGNTTFLGVYSSFIGAEVNSSLTHNIATGSGRSVGMDLLLQGDFGKHHGWIGYSLMKADSKYNIQDATRVPETFEQRHEVKVYYELELARWDFSLLWVYGSGRPYTPFLGIYSIDLPDGSSASLPIYGDLNSLRLPAYIRTDLAISYNFGFGKSRGKMQFSVFNLFDRTNIKDVQYLAIKNDENTGNFEIAERRINMLGFLPSINLQLKF